MIFADLCTDNDEELGVGIKKSETPRKRHVEDELRPRRDRRGGGVIRDPTGLPATSQSPSPRADGSLIRGEFLTDLRENKSV